MSIVPWRRLGREMIRGSVRVEEGGRGSGGLGAWLQYAGDKL